MTPEEQERCFADDARTVREGVAATPTKHIALFIYALTGGGAQRRTVTLANGFAALGHEVDLVVVNGHNGLEGELASSVRIVTLDGFGRLHVRVRRLSDQRGLQTALAIPALARYLREVRPDALLSAASHVNLVAVAAMRLARVPVALILRASNHPSGNLVHHPPLQRLVRAWMKWLARRFYPRADAVITVSEGVAREIIRLSAIPPEKVRVVRNPVVTARLRQRMVEPLDHPWFAPGAPPVILGAGRFKLQKDFFTLLDAFGRLRRTRAARLVILGDGPGRSAIEAEIRRAGLADDVFLPGYVANPLPWMRRARLFVLSSLWEGLPGVVVEALACGLPVVSTDCPSGPAEILDGGRFGRLVTVGDAAAMAEAMAASLAESPDRAMLRARAESFALAPAIAAYVEVLEKAIAARARERLAWATPWPLRVPLRWSSDDGLAYVLGRHGLNRGDLFRPWPGNADHRQRLARMMARFGVDPDEAAARHWRAMRLADWRCGNCTAVTRCRNWLEGVAPASAARAFCPNAPLLADLGGDREPASPVPRHAT